MPAGPKGIHVRVIFRVEDFVQKRRALFKPISVLVPNVEVNLETLESCGILCKRERAVLLPVSFVGRRTESVAQDPHIKSPAAVGRKGIRERGRRWPLQRNKTGPDGP